MRIHLGANTRPISYEYYTKNINTEQTTSATYYYHYDLHGNVIRVTDSSGTTEITYTYDQLGTVVSETNTNSIYNPFTYMGEAQIIQDSEFDTSSASPKTGLYSSGSGYYNPETGTFIQGAGVPLTTNPTSNFAEMAMATESRLQQQQMVAAASSINGGRKTGVTQAMSKSVKSAKPNQGENPPDPAKLPRPEATWTMSLGGDLYIHDPYYPVRLPGDDDEILPLNDGRRRKQGRLEPPPVDTIFDGGGIPCSSFDDYSDYSASSFAGKPRDNGCSNDTSAFVVKESFLRPLDCVEVARGEYYPSYAEMYYGASAPASYSDDGGGGDRVCGSYIPGQPTPVPEPGDNSGPSQCIYLLPERIDTSIDEDEWMYKKYNTNSKAKNMIDKARELMVYELRGRYTPDAIHKYLHQVCLLTRTLTDWIFMNFKLTALGKDTAALAAQIFALIIKYDLDDGWRWMNRARDNQDTFRKWLVERLIDLGYIDITPKNAV